ncbi:uncharacterized protein Z519_01831 [Cladophialophora bantiana CBS 173.52]|uniref:Uncharacterized protein n=1 Tax=Cladophialophora bantiana (strain ATCC 10958 / CBS 173.52 / CDC B-1940 / NIH 8579) TaxID=1442370 RepID=A0A0D2GIN5_CLAB1|nr:uncharacterized protein Z519_01831 [Cladophialophora bantiana CBS 173.52]KIW98247.1 hypothetical protein Z519_01831 [Cladophialophora bantiana CBS 173.52]
MFLSTAGSIPVLMGLVSTTIYPSSDLHVVVSLVVGFVILILFALWKTYGVTNMFYYSSRILWPTMINVFYTDNGVNWIYASVLSMVQGLAITPGGTYWRFSDVESGMGTDRWAELLQSRTVENKVGEYVPAAVKATRFTASRIDDLLCALGKPHLDRTFPALVAAAATRAWQ